MARILGCPPSPLYSLDWTRHTYYLSGLPDILSQGANSRCDAVSRMIGGMLDQNAQRYGESESVVKRPQRTETLRQSREAKLQASNVEQLLNGLRERSGLQGCGRNPQRAAGVEKDAGGVAADQEGAPEKHFATATKLPPWSPLSSSAFSSSAPASPFILIIKGNTMITASPPLSCQSWPYLFPHL